MNGLTVTNAGDGGYRVGDLHVPASAPGRIREHFKDLVQYDIEATFKPREEYDALMSYGTRRQQALYLAPLGGQVMRAMSQPRQDVPIDVMMKMANHLLDSGFAVAHGQVKRTGMFPLWLMSNAVLLHHRRIRNLSPHSTKEQRSEFATGLAFTACLAANLETRQEYEAAVGDPTDWDRDMARTLIKEMGYTPALKTKATLHYSVARAFIEVAARNEGSDAVKDLYSKVDTQFRTIYDILVDDLAFWGSNSGQIPGGGDIQEFWGMRLSSPGPSGYTQDIMLTDPRYGDMWLHPWYLGGPQRLGVKAALFASRLETPVTWATTPLVYRAEGKPDRVAWGNKFPTSGLYDQSMASALLRSSLGNKNKQSERFALTKMLPFVRPFLKSYPEINKHHVVLKVNDDTHAEQARIEKKVICIYIHMPEEEANNNRSYWARVYDPLSHNVLCRKIFHLLQQGVAMLVGEIDRDGGYNVDPFAALNFATMDANKVLEQ